MYLYYDKVLELDECSEFDARELGNKEMLNTKLALMTYYEISIEVIS